MDVVKDVLAKLEPVRPDFEYEGLDQKIKLLDEYAHFANAGDLLADVERTRQAATQPKFDEVAAEMWVNLIHSVRRIAK